MKPFLSFPVFYENNTSYFPRVPEFCQLLRSPVRISASKLYSFMEVDRYTQPSYGHLCINWKRNQPHADRLKTRIPLTFHWFNCCGVNLELPSVFKTIIATSVHLSSKHRAFHLNLEMTKDKEIAKCDVSRWSPYEIHMNFNPK